ncbi:MAG: carboxypeptidase-like regulatory domain-containing protein [Prevotella sp.]|nr:carboxypeptidase-like regulatory domain-containing protein [Prevotella sp.]
MKHVLLTLWVLLVGTNLLAQETGIVTGENGNMTVISGTVCHEKTDEPIRQASVVVEGTSVSVVTNDDGFFTLKAEGGLKEISVSHVGFHTKRIRIGNDSHDLRIKLKPNVVELNEVVVWTGDPRELVNIAISKIPENYINKPELYQGFYRETAMKRQHYIYVAEGVVDMYKSSYSSKGYRDRVAIRKGRRLLSPKRGDTLSIKVLGGPVFPIQLDIAKNLDFFLNAENLLDYQFTMEEPTTINDRQQYVVSLSPRWVKPWALYYGKLYIDRLTLAFTRAELSLDVSNREKATQYMLVKKPAGVKFRPKELTTLIDYRYEDGLTHISYIRNTFRFNCDWKRRLFATSFAAFCEMVVTDKTSENVRPISGRNSFDSRDAFYDKVDYFKDPHFWENYNIIEPSESLDKAIDKLVKRYK